MSAIDELKAIIANQEFISAAELGPIVKQIETMYIQQAKTLRKQRIQLGKFHEKEVKPYERRKFNV